MTAVHSDLSASAVARTPGAALIVDGQLVSTNPATGEEVGRFPIAGPDDVGEAVARAQEAARWWRELGFTGRRERLLRWRRVIARRLPELLALMHAEGGKPNGEALIESVPAIDHIAWSARNAPRVLGTRRVKANLLLPEFAGVVMYEPYGVVAVIGPWNYPILTPIGSIAYALAAGNAVVFKPSEYTPAVADWYVRRFAEIVPEQPVLQTVFGFGETGEHLVRAGVDKVAFTGSPRTARKIMAACAQTLTPVLIEGGGKDAMIVDADADLDLAADTCVWGAMTNAGQTCAGLERVYVLEPVFDTFVDKVVDRAGRLQASEQPSADFGPITMPGQLDIIRRHIEDAIARGGQVRLGGPQAVAPPFVHPTVIVNVPEDAATMCEETFGPVIVVNPVATVDDAIDRANASAYGLGGSVFGKARAMQIARRLRVGMVSINSAVAFAAIPGLPFGGVGESGFGRIHGDDGLREFARVKSIARRRMRSLVPIMSYTRKPRHLRLVARAIRLVHGR